MKHVSRTCRVSNRIASRNRGCLSPCRAGRLLDTEASQYGLEAGNRSARSDKAQARFAASRGTSAASNGSGHSGSERKVGMDRSTAVPVIHPAGAAGRERDRHRLEFTPDAETERTGTQQDPRTRPGDQNGRAERRRKEGKNEERPEGA